MTLFSIIITGFLYLFIATALPIKKAPRFLYLIFGILLIILPFVVDVNSLKLLVIFLLYLPLIVLGIFKSKIFK